MTEINHGMVLIVAHQRTTEVVRAIPRQPPMPVLNRHGQHQQHHPFRLPLCLRSSYQMIVIMILLRCLVSRSRSLSKPHIGVERKASVLEM